jgi:hypothetical protein
MNPNIQFPRQVKLASQVAEINEHLVAICEKLAGNPKLEILIHSLLGLKFKLPNVESDVGQEFVRRFLQLNPQFLEAQTNPNREFLVIELLLAVLYNYHSEGLSGYLSDDLKTILEQCRESATLINP